MKRMTAKYNGRCKDCGRDLRKGDTIRWSRATGALCAGECHYGDGDGDYELAAARRDEAEYQRGYHETRLAQMAGPAGSAAREAAYLEMEMAAYNRGED